MVKLTGMDTGMGAHLEAVIAANPGMMIGQNLETGHWEAIRKPSPSCEILVHAPTLAELSIKLEAEGSAS
jgi:hypothetical protein